MSSKSKWNKKHIIFINLKNNKCSYANLTMTYRIKDVKFVETKIPAEWKNHIKQYLRKKMPNTKLDKLFQNLDMDFVPDIFRNHMAKPTELINYKSKNL